MVVIGVGGKLNRGNRVSFVINFILLASILGRGV
jgi:hypothetical protein